MKKEVYEMSSIEKIQASTFAYLFPLKEEPGDNHYSIYLKLQNKEDLVCLWFSEGKDEQLLKYQIKDESMELPYYHFQVDEMGTRPEALIGNMLRAINPQIKVLGLSGSTPYTC